MLLEVAGVQVSDMDMDEVLAHIVGPEGTHVRCACMNLTMLSSCSGSSTVFACNQPSMTLIWFGDQPELQLEPLKCFTSRRR